MPKSISADDIWFDRVQKNRSIESEPTGPAEYRIRFYVGALSIAETDPAPLHSQLWEQFVSLLLLLIEPRTEKLFQLHQASTDIGNALDSSHSEERLQKILEFIRASSLRTDATPIA